MQLPLRRWQAVRTWARLTLGADALWRVDVRALLHLAALELGQLVQALPPRLRQRVNRWLCRLGVATRLNEGPRSGSGRLPIAPPGSGMLGPSGHPPMDWQHGYHAESTYTCGFYRELAPAWLDFAALLKGQPSPRWTAPASFRYLELGSGMGLGLCLLAAAHPEGEFTGVDFQPDHILHSRRLSQALQLTNIRFLEADFLQLAAAPAELEGSHHYVVAHGIATWIAAPIRKALLELAAIALRPGGLFYCSYNTLPGWLAAFPLQQLAWIESQRRSSTPTGAAEAVRQASSTLQSLLGSPEHPSALAQALPGLRDRISALATMDTAYLVQEYINEGWQPLAAHTFHSLVAGHKLRFMASATLPDNFHPLLPDNIRDAVINEPDPLIRESLQDLAINQSFRRDIFCRGSYTLSSTELADHFNGLRFRLQEAPDQETYVFSSNFGQITASKELCAGIETSLADGPLGFGELLERHGLTLPRLAQVLSLLLHAGRVGLDRGQSQQAASQSCDHAHTALGQLQLAGRPYGFRPVASLGSAVSFSLPEALLEQALRSNPGADPLPALTAGLVALERNLVGDPAEVLATYRRRRPGLVTLGLLPG